MFDDAVDFQQMFSAMNEEENESSDVEVDKCICEEEEDSNEQDTNMDIQNENTSNTVIKMDKNDCVSVSDIILNNLDKLVNTFVLNNVISQSIGDMACNLTSYIVYINTKKNIPCIFDCDKLYVPKTTVLNDNGDYLVESIEGRRSGFVIKLTNDRNLVMSKNFIYDVVFENGKISSVFEYNRKNEKTPLDSSYHLTDFDSATLAVRSVLPKIVKNDRCQSMEQLLEDVRKSYNSVDDINAMFKIIELMKTIGA